MARYGTTLATRQDTPLKGNAYQRTPERAERDLESARAAWDREQSWNNEIRLARAEQRYVDTREGWWNGQAG